MHMATAIAMHLWLIPILVLICLSVHDMRVASWYDRGKFLSLVMFWPVAIPALLGARRIMEWRKTKNKKG